MKMRTEIFLFLFSLFSVILAESSKSASEDEQEEKYVTLEGKVSVSNALDIDWMTRTHILVNGGQYKGYLRSDGSFAISQVDISGSYIVEVINPTYYFESLRVEVNSKGKVRVRRLNHVNPADKDTLPYPLKFKARGFINYFQKREQWRITDFLMSPMVLMMVAPLILVMVLPKLMNAQDPETQREVAQSMNMFTPKQNMPDVSEYLTSLFGGGSGGSANKQRAAPSAVKPKLSKKK